MEWLYSTLTDGEYMLTKTVLDPKEDGTYDQATMYVTFVFGTPYAADAVYFKNMT